MNTIDLLMSMDKGTFKPRTQQVKISRLSEEKKPFIVDLRGLTQDELEEISDQIVKDLPDGTKKVDGSERIYLTLIKGITNINFKDENLLKHFEVRTPYDLLKKIFLPGEMEKLESAISKLCGFNIDAITEVKN